MFRKILLLLKNIKIQDRVKIGQEIVFLVCLHLFVCCMAVNQKI